MSYQLTYANSIYSKVDALTYAGTNNVNTNITSSNGIQQTVLVNTSSYTQLSLGSLSDVRAVWLYNDNTTYSASVINVATGSTGGNRVATLLPGDSTLLTWSGSFNSLYAEVINGATANGITQGQVQYVAIQS